MSFPDSLVCRMCSMKLGLYREAKKNKRKQKRKIGNMARKGFSSLYNLQSREVRAGAEARATPCGLLSVVTL